MTPQLLKLTAAKYHADDIGHERPSLSASCATTIVAECPFLGWLGHPKMGKVKREATDDMNRGTLIHALLFGEPTEQFAFLDFKDYRKKEAQTARDDAEFAGKVPMLSRKRAEAEEAADEIRKAIAEEGFTLDGQSEMTAVWEEETASGPILCRGLMDHVFLENAVILDLKNTTDAHPKKIARSMIDHGYDVQHAAYTSAIRKLNPDMAGREDFTFLFCEMLPEASPKRVLLTVARPDGSMKEHGRARWESACEKWAACLKSGVWPGYGTVSIAAPNWALSDLQEATS